MENNILTTMELLAQKNELESRLKTLLWGTIEERKNSDKRYIYLHKRENGVRYTVYVGEYDDMLKSRILADNLEAKALKKQLRAIKTDLKKVGYSSGELSEKVKLNIDFAKRNMVDTIYKQALLEGVADSFFVIRNNI